jgi:hypothetical protein
VLAVVTSPLGPAPGPARGRAGHGFHHEALRLRRREVSHLLPRRRSRGGGGGGEWTPTACPGRREGHGRRLWALHRVDGGGGGGGGDWSQRRRLLRLRVN